MKRLIYLSMVVACLALGCGTEIEPAVPPAQAAKQMEAVFETADPALKRQAQSAAAALRNNDYEKAFVALEMLKTQHNLSVDQTKRVHSSMQSLQSRLAEGVVNGDPGAIRAAQAIRSMQPR